MRKVARGHRGGLLEDGELMTIALLGAAGRIGAEILEEALRRGHEVVAVVRSPGRIEERPGLKVVVADAYDANGLAAAISGYDAFISAFSPDPNEPFEGKPERLRQSHEAILTAVRRAEIGRVILVGGVGSLWAEPGVLVVDSEEYGNHNAGPTRANLTILEGLRADGGDLDWFLRRGVSRRASARECSAWRRTT
jgi:uncharacterized protein